MKIGGLNRLPDDLGYIVEPMTQMTIEQAMQLVEGHLQAGRPAEAAALARQILQIDPAHKGAIVHLGISLHGMGKIEEARAVFEQGIQTDTTWAEGWNNLGVTLRQIARLDDAIAAFRKALELRPDFPDALSNLGNALHDAGDPVAAVPMHERSIALRPDFVTAHCNLANALKFSGRIDEAIAAYRRALTLSPHDPAIHHYLGLTLLLSGDYPQGMAEHEWRVRIRDPRPICWDFPKPRWDGRPLAGQRILIHAEQGLGDTVQFVRYLPLVAGRGGKIILHCQQELGRLLREIPGVEQVISPTDASPAYDVHCQLMSLPYFFGTTAATIPAPKRYIHANAVLSMQWRQRLHLPARLKVGLCWAGRKHYTDDRNRSMSLAMLSPLAQIAGVQWVSLQKGDASTDALQWPASNFTNPAADLTDFAETAALIDNLDLVISVDTSVAHLAGAMGKPVWILLPFVPDWRWMLGRADSPWYPSARLFRQERSGDWSNVMASLKQALEDLAR